MALTRDYKETVLARIRRDRKFARLFHAGAIKMLLEGQTTEGLSRLRDPVHAEITFKELARQTGLGEKTLHRMLNRNGDPTPAGQEILGRFFPDSILPLGLPLGALPATVILALCFLAFP